MRITVVINPGTPAQMESLRAAVEILRAEGHVVLPRVTFEGGDAARFAGEAVEGASDLLVAAGGDGTINEVVNGIFDAPPLPESGGPRLGIVPLGTGNDLAGALGLPEGPDEALLAAARGVPAHFDVGLLNGRCFVNVSTGGMGAAATQETESEMKRFFGPFAYLLKGMRRLIDLEPCRGRFLAEDAEEIYDGPFVFFAVGNSGRTGGGNWVAPRADPSDRLLDVCIVKWLPKRELLGLLPEIRAGRHLEHPAVLYRQMRGLTVEAHSDIHVNMDGEPITSRVFRYGVAPRSLLLSLPVTSTVEREGRVPSSAA